MRSKDMVRRLERMEAAEQARKGRVYDRVFTDLTDMQLEHLVGVLQAHPDGVHSVELASDDQRIVCLVEQLVLADPEMRPGDLLGVPAAWMDVYSNGGAP